MIVVWDGLDKEHWRVLYIGCHVECTLILCIRWNNYQSHSVMISLGIILLTSHHNSHHEKPFFSEL